MIGPPKGGPHVLRDGKGLAGGPYVLSIGCGRRRARNRFAEDLDRAEVNVSAGAMTTARHQIGEPDLIDLRQIRIDDPDFVVPVRRAGASAAVHRDDPHRVETNPAHVRERDLSSRQHRDRSVSMIAYEHRSVGELHDRTDDVEPGGLDHPADFSEPRQVEHVVLLFERNREWALALAGPGAEGGVLASHRT